MKKIFNKRIKLIIFTIALFIVINITLSFSYLSGRTINNESVSTVALKAGDIQVRYTDNSGVINATGISPGYEITKQFTVTSEYGETHQYYEGDLWYTVSLIIEKNEFDDNSLKYSLSLDESSDNDGLSLPNLSDIGIPTGVNLDGLVLGSGMFKSDNKSHKYNLTISYPDNGEDQSYEIESEFKAYIGFLTPDMYELTIDLDGGSIDTILLDENSVVEVPANSRINLPIPTKENCPFVGWEIVNGNERAYNNIITTNQSDISIKALWKKAIFNFDYTGGEQEFIAEVPGYYKLETWGAQGGIGTSTYSNYGGYSVGTVFLNISDIIYVNVGGVGQSAKSGSGNISYGGYNGGGNGGTGTQGGSGGGGASHISTISGELKDIGISNVSKVLIVSGGGGGTDLEDTHRGSGGGYLGTNGGYEAAYTNYYATGGSQSTGGKDNAEGSNYASFGQGGSYFTTYGGNGGGGGYYGGGGSSRNHSGGGGGSGYVGNSLLTDKYMYCYNCETSDVESTKTYTTTCAEEIPTENCAKIGNGYARITYLHS